MRKVCCVMLAGGINKIPLYEGYQPSYKALLEFNKKKSIEYVLQAVKGSKNISRILIIGPVKDLTPIIKDKRIKIIQSKEKITQDIKSAIIYFREEEKILITSPDIPLVKAKAFDDFIVACNGLEGDVLLSIVNKKDLHYDSKKHFLPLKGGPIAHGNLVMLSTKVPNDKIDIMQEFYEERKKGLLIANVLGTKFLIYFI